jgi:C-terminal processing protease CtpA/Prc
MVGMRFLREFRTTFDVAHDRIELERTSDGPVRSPSIRGPGADFFRKDDMWTVWYVVKGAPADRAGLRAGDRVESIDGRPTSSAGIDDYYSDLLANKDGMKLRVVHDGVARDVDVAIVTLVE